MRAAKGAPIDTDRVFRLNDTQTLSYLDFDDLTAEDLKAIGSIRGLYLANRSAFTELTVSNTPDKKKAHKRNNGSIDWKGSSLSWDSANGNVTVAIKGRAGTYRKETLTSPHVFDLVLNAGWFEAEVARILSSWRHSHEVRLNVTFPYTEGNPKNEIDVIVNTSDRLLFVECKTSIHTLTDLDKFSKAVRNYGGTGCHALFVSFTSMSKDAAEKCRDNGIIPFSFKDTLNASRDKSKQQEVIAKALHRLLDEKLITINKK